MAFELDLNDHRGGCIVCMNYSAYSKSFNYFGLVADFSFIDDILVNKLHQFVQEEFIPEQIFIFGFSFGAQLALEAGRRFGKKLIGRIDGELIKIEDPVHNQVKCFFVA